MQRANALKQILVDAGVDPSRIHIESMGESQANVDDDATDEERREDRKEVLQLTIKEQTKDEKE